MSKRFRFADDDPMLATFPAMSSEQLASLRVDLGRVAQVKASEQTLAHSRIARITQILRSRTRSRWDVTDHAVVRYLERVKGIDLDAIRQEIASIIDGAAERVPVKGDATGLVANGLTFVVTGDGRVVTIHPIALSDGVTGGVGK
jgi:hypothetical protein